MASQREAQMMQHFPLSDVSHSHLPAELCTGSGLWLLPSWSNTMLPGTPFPSALLARIISVGEHLMGHTHGQSGTLQSSCSACRAKGRLSSKTAKGFNNHLQNTHNQIKSCPLNGLKHFSMCSFNPGN